MMSEYHELEWWEESRTQREEAVVIGLCIYPYLARGVELRKLSINL